MNTTHPYFCRHCQAYREESGAYRDPGSDTPRCTICLNYLTAVEDFRDLAGADACLRAGRMTRADADLLLEQIARHALAIENLFYALERPETFDSARLAKALRETTEPTVTMTEHLQAADMDEAAYVREQQRQARERILRRALRSTPNGDPRRKDY